MKKVLASIMIVACTLLTSNAIAQKNTHNGKAAPSTKNMMNTDAGIKLRLAMRKLWEDHIGYTRGYIISAVADLKDKDTVAQRLLKNQDDIGNAIKPFYGDEAGAKLSGLLRDHIVIATEVVAAAKGNDQDKLKAASDKWNSNAKDIANFLSEANPNWKQNEVLAMLQKHLELTTKEAASRLKGDWAADIKANDQNHDHMLMFADALTDGIIKQFPDKIK